MNTILYIGDTYITTLFQLKSILSSHLLQDTPTYDEILTLFWDDILVQWLNEGDEEERNYATKIKMIDTSKANSSIMSDLLKIFSKSMSHEYKCDYTQYLSLLNVSCVINDVSTDITKIKRYSIDTKQKDPIIISATFKINKVDNEHFSFHVYNNNSKILEKGLDLRLLKTVGEFKLEIPLKDIKTTNCISINIDDITVFSILIEIEDNLSFDVCGVYFKMIKVEKGKFLMGTNNADREKPIHEVELSDYYIGETVVTQELWTVLMGYNRSYFKGNELPVETVRWDECQDFINKLNEVTGKRFRLPTEAEWEFAARGGNKEKDKNYKYSGGNDIDKVAWYDWNSNGKTHSVKDTKRPNALGVYGMSGNVREWCQDWYGSYRSISEKNPKGPSSGSYHIVRGGSWGSDSSFCEVTYRYRYTMDKRGEHIGFRLAL